MLAGRRRWCRQARQRRGVRTTWRQTVPPDRRTYWHENNMDRCLRDMRTRAGNVRHLVEIRDARIPFCTHPYACACACSCWG